MSYLVLARKYRPRTLTDVVGQDHVVRPLSNALKSGRIAHAYLFSGARGVGKTTAARLLAMALNCPAPVEQRPCGQCDSCREIIEGQAVDVFEVDGASNRGIDEIRQLRDTVKYLPGKGQYKVYIVDEVHMLTPQAFNALLKTLEEPPDHVIFIFATTEAHKVLPTILSRCQRYDFKRIRQTDLVTRLQSIAQAENIRISYGALRLLARESEGSLRDALSLFDQAIAYCGLTIEDQDVIYALGLIDQTMVSTLVSTILAGQAGPALDCLDQIMAFGYDTKDLAVQALEFIRSLVIAKVSVEPEKILDLLDAELATFKSLAGRYSLETLNFHMSAWLEVQGRLTRSSQPRLVLETLIVRLAQVEPLQPLAELIARLEAFLGAGYPASPTAGSAPRRASTAPAEDSPKKERPLTAPVLSPPTTPIQETQSEAPAVTPVVAPVSHVPQQPDQRPEDSTGLAAEATPVSLDWDTFLTRVKGDNPLLHSLLVQGQALQFGRSKVVIRYHKKGLTDLIDKDKLRGFLHDFLGSRPALSLEFDETAAAADLAAAQSVAEQTRKNLLDHPIVKEAQLVLPGHIIDVIPEISEE